MSKTNFELEQQILDCWHVVDDLNILFESICDHPDFAGMDAKHEDKISNMLLGMKELYQLKFERCFATYEKLLKEQHEHNTTTSR